MTRNTIIILFGLIVFYSIYKLVYKPYVLCKEVKISAEKLQVGSYIFTNQMEHNGSQSSERGYTIFKVTQIVEDYVRLAVVRKFYASQKASDLNLSAFDGYFSASKEVYDDAKKTIKDKVVTAVKIGDIDDFNNLVLTDSLRLKYPSLSNSRLFVEDVSNLIKPTKDSPVYGDKLFFFSLVYSKKEIINKAQLIPYLYNSGNDDMITLEYGYSKDIDKIINLNK